MYEHGLHRGDLLAYLPICLSGLSCALFAKGQVSDWDSDVGPYHIVSLFVESGSENCACKD